MSSIDKRAKESLWEQFKKTSDKSIDSKGYVSEPEHNLLPGIKNN